MLERNVKESGYGIFPVVLKIVAVICVIIGFIAASEISFIWGVTGIVTALVWWALSDIVEACQCYIKNNKR